MMQPSQYQKKILDWLENGNGNATCNAVAGSGKTTTLKLAAEKLRAMNCDIKDIAVIVFAKQNSLDLIAKFGQEWKYSINTLHSVGFRILQKEIGKFSRDERKNNISNFKYRRIAEDRRLIPKKTKKKNKYKGSLILNESISRVEHFLTLINLVRLTLSDLSIESIRRICDHHNLGGIHNYKRVTDEIASILIEGQEQAINSHRIDFTDMTWLPVEWALNQKRWFKTYQWVLTDECQDLNAAQLELSLMLAGDRGRMLYVGDPKQAIFGFAGADNRSYQKIVERTKATEFPLSLCYRCPKSHVDLVNLVYPEIPIESREKAAPGVLEIIEKSDLWDKEHPGHLVVGDMVLSRKTAPLVSLCIRLIGQGIAATVKGRDIGKQIKSELEAIADIHNFKYKDFNVFVERYREFKYQTYENLDNAEQLKETLADKLTALSTIYSSQPNATCIAHLCTYIDDLFSDEESPITLSTCHRAKGLESDRIFIIKPEDMPMVWEKQQKWQKEQEDNLLYVALTRSKSALYIVGHPDWFTKELKELTEKQIKKDLAASVNDLHSESNIDIQSILTLISELDFKDKCDLFNTFKDSLTQEKWLIATEALKLDPNRSDRAISSTYGFSTPFVSKVRKKLIEEEQIDIESIRVDKRGYKHQSPISSD